jgi:glycosyltransferase involved in cell wall biosynthesis
MSTKKTTSKAPVTQRPAKQAAPLLPPDFIQPGFWGQHLFPTLVLMAISFVLYGITVSYGYLQDDQLFIWDNSFVQKGFAGLAEIFGHDSLLGYYKDPKLMLEGGRYRPLPLATFAMEIGLFGKDNPGVAHFFNVLFYGLTGILLYRVILALFPTKSSGYWFFSVPFLAAAIFMLHPLHVEVVANIKSRDEIFALLGSLGALWAILKYFDTQENRWRWIAAGSFLLGLLSKENTATFLAVIPLSLWVFSKLPLGRIVSACMPLLAAVLLFLLLRALALETPIKHPDELVLNPFLGMAASEKFASIFLSLGWSLKLLFVPHPLTIDYYPYHVPKVSWTDWRVLVSLAGYLAMGVWAVRQLKKTRDTEASGSLVPAFCILYFLLTISVVSNIFVRTSTFLNERYLFMPSVGFCLLVAWFAARKLPELLRKPYNKPNLWSAVLIGAIALLFGLRTWTRVPDWGGDGRSLVESAIRVSSGSYRANYYYANYLYQERYLKIEKATDAALVAERNTLLDTISHYLNRSLEINPGYRLAAPLKVQMAVGRFNQDKDLDKLLKALEALIQNQPANGAMLTMVLEVLKSLKGADPNIYNFFCHRVGYNFYFVKKHDPEGAITFLNLALANYPQDKNTMQDLIQVYTSTGNQAKLREMQQRMAQ